MNLKRIVFYGVPIALLIFTGIAEITGLFERPELGVYDMWLRIKPPVTQREEVLFVDVDDLAITRVGVWPWSREVLARRLITMREFGAGHTIFDIEYVDPSPVAVDGRMLRQEIPEDFDRAFAEITTSMEGLIQAIARGQIRPAEAAEFLGELSEITQGNQERLLRRVGQIVQNNDELLGRAAAAHGNAWFTVNLIPDEPDETPRERIDFARPRTALSRVGGAAPLVRDVPGFRPTIEPVLAGARGAGFPNVVIDSDGVRRRIELFRTFEGDFYGQLVIPALLDLLGNPEVEITDRRVVLRDARHPDSTDPQDITIPLAQDGTLLIHWPPGAYVDSFRHLSVYELIFYEERMADLGFNLQLMAEAGYVNYHDGDIDLLELWEYGQFLVEEALDRGEPGVLDELRPVRDYFLREMDAFLRGPAEDLLLADIQAFLQEQRETMTVDEIREVEELLDDVPAVFSATRAVLADVEASEAALLAAIPDSFIIIGYTGTGTTDIGVNPFENEYANTGTHGAVFNTIMTGQFIVDLPHWTSVVIAVFATALFLFLTVSRSATVTLATGFGGAALVTAVSAGMMVGARIFMPILPPVITLILSAVTQSGYKYIEVARERSFIRNAFNHYLSTDVINQIMDDPSMLALGGEKRELTAMFTDVKGFSSISEVLDPTDLVQLLNEYLSAMSDVVLELRGTIDKFEGDAIISFFGAPVPFTDHPLRACKAAVRMKKIEEELNKTFLSRSLTPTPLATRIGINTGEMVVGNMGTATRMDYTIMGNAVNLAARLEGVNKQYGTWILTSQYTVERRDGEGPEAAVGSAAGDSGVIENELVTRRLDRVRVVGINEPVRLYEILDIAGEAPAETTQLVAEFHAGLEHFEHRQWSDAGRIFSRILEAFPEDGPGRTYASRCDTFMKEEPTQDWDGVFNLTQK